MKIQVSTNSAEVSRVLQGLFRDQLPFATSKAINRTAKDAQQAQREHMATVFTIRRPTFVNRSVKIKPFSTKRRLEATVLIEPPGGQRTADIIARHEERGRRRPHTGGTLALPVEARPSKASLVRRDLLPKKFQFERVSTTRSGTQIFRGRKRTFMIRRFGKSGVILQRTSKGRSGTFAGTRLLYRLEPWTPIEPRLRFFDTVEAAVKRRFDENFRDAFHDAIRTAR